MVMFFLKDGWSSKKTWTPLEGGASPTSLPTHCLTSRCCRLTNEKGDIYKKKRKNYHLWQQLSFFPSQGAIGTRSYSFGCFWQNHRWDPGWACHQEKIVFEVFPFLQTRSWPPRLGSTWTSSRGRASITSSPREWSSKCGWPSSLSFTPDHNNQLSQEWN